MEDLVEKMKVVLASSFAFYLKVQNYHWNVEGPNFSQFHDFFGELYTEIHTAVDDIAEHIRTLDVYVPGSFQRFKELSVVLDEYTVPSAIMMCHRLEQDNRQLIQVLEHAYKEAETQGKLGLANYLQDRIDIHEKHGWMLRSFKKG